MSKGRIAVIAVVVIALIFLLWLWGSYNGLVRSDETVNEKWANVEAQYQRRVDLIPNLVSTVQAVVEFEKGTQTEIAALRTRAVAVRETFNSATNAEERLAAMIESDDIASRYNGFKINVENYPELKASENFLSLQDELSGTENRIAIARREFNEVVKAYNVKVRRVPTNVVAKWFGFEQKDM
ncbi:LemA family protein, partial [Candidatus Woesearchaeota archaeon]|nr:LemA family protein [Candidatus Woesearchaeota archaeon]